MAPPSVGAQAVPSVALAPVAGGFVSPLIVTHAGDSSGRLFVVEQGGTIRIVRNGSLLPSPFLDVTSIIVSGGERGLLGLAFHPGYARNGRFFVFSTAANGDNTLAEKRVSADPNRADPASGRVLFAIPDPCANHNGGVIAFGPNGYLYIGTGDGGYGDARENGESLQTLRKRQVAARAAVSNTGWAAQPLGRVHEGWDRVGCALQRGRFEGGAGSDGCG